MSAATTTHSHDDIVYPSGIPFLLLHIACLGAIWTGVDARAVIVAIALYVVRMFAVTGGYHRYFSHRTYKTSRVFQFILAFLAQSSGQRGALWWAAQHRHHHRHSDTEHDIHSPKHHGLFYAHVGWVFTEQPQKPDYSGIKDFAEFPEMRWLDRFHHVPTIVVGTLAFLIGGWSGLVVGFCWSTVAVYHATFAINSFAHVWGKKRFYTGDDSRNNPWLALVTLGEGWHNNHHYYMGSVRQGFRWYEFDITFYILKLLSFFRIVWDLNPVPESAIKGERRLSRALVAKAIEEIGAEVPEGSNETMIETVVRKVLGNSPSVPEVVSGIRASRTVTA